MGCYALTVNRFGKTDPNNGAALPFTVPAMLLYTTCTLSVHSQEVLAE